MVNEGSKTNNVLWIKDTYFSKDTLNTVSENISGLLQAVDEVV